MDRLNDTAKSYDININVNKTEVMKVGRNGGVINILVDRQKIR